MFSKSCEYGIRALTVVGKAQLKGQKIGIKDICKLANTPESFTAKILQNLVKRKILSSQKGPSGGFYFDRKLEEISLEEIVVAIDGEKIFQKCGMGFSICNAKNPCPMHNHYKTLRAQLKKMCHNNNLLNLSNNLNPKLYYR